MKKMFLLLTVALTLATSARAQLVTYTFESGTAAPTFADGDVTASNFTRNPGNVGSVGTPGNPGNSIGGSGWTEADRFWEFTVTANQGLVLDLSSLSFDYRSTGTGPTGYQITINGGNLTSGSLLNDSSFHTLPLPISGYNSLSSAQLRVYASGASSGAGTLRIDNVTLNGLTVTPVPEPSTWVLLITGSVFLVSRMRRRN